MMSYAEALPPEPVPVADTLARLNGELREASAQTILRAAILREWPGRIGYVASFGAESAVMLALIADIKPDLPVLFIDTGRHFPQTLQYRDEVIDTLGLTGVQTLSPSLLELREQDPDGKLHQRDADACCAVRKVAPLERALPDFDAWITGRKRFHGGPRMRLPVFEESNGQFKVNPLAGWGREDVQRFFTMRNLPKHPLVEQGYPSIGCWPCTAPVAVDAEGVSDIRAGRWAGQDKTECGLHIDKKERPRVF